MTEYLLFQNSFWLGVRMMLEVMRGDAEDIRWIKKRTSFLLKKKKVHDMIFLALDGRFGGVCLLLS